MKTKHAKKEGKQGVDDESPLKGSRLKELRAGLSRNWKIVKGRHLDRQFKFKDFKEALKFANVVGKAAERQGHHPDIFLTWGEVRLRLWTHSADGLTENDFRLASAVDGLA